MLRPPEGRVHKRQCVQILPLNQNAVQNQFIQLESRFSPGRERSSFRGEISVAIPH